MREIKERKVIKDIWLATFLKAIGKKYITYEKRDDGMVFFVFEDNNLDEAIEEYNSGDAVVNVSDFVQAYRGLKTIIYQVKGEARNGRDE